MVMKRMAAAVLAITLILLMSACAGAEEKAETQERTQDEVATPDADWNLPETIEMSEKVTTVFEKAIDGMTGVSYEPIGYLGVCTVFFAGQLLCIQGQNRIMRLFMLVTKDYRISGISGWVLMRKRSNARWVKGIWSKLDLPDLFQMDP